MNNGITFFLDGKEIPARTGETILEAAERAGAYIPRLCWMKGLTAAATAEACGCSLATAKIRIHRARARLREALNQECIFYRDRDDVFRCDRKPSQHK